DEESDGNDSDDSTCELPPLSRFSRELEDAQELELDAVDIKAVPVVSHEPIADAVAHTKKTKKTGWLSKVGGKLAAKQEKNQIKPVKTMEPQPLEEELHLAATQPPPVPGKETKQRKSLSRRFRSIGRGNRLTILKKDAHGVVPSSTLSSTASSSSSSSSSDEDYDCADDIDGLHPESSIERVRTSRWTFDLGLSGRRRSGEEHAKGESVMPAVLPGADGGSACAAERADGSSNGAAAADSSSEQDMHCPMRRHAYLGSVRKLQDSRRPLREMVGVHSVLAEVRRVGGVRVPVREVHAALAAGERDIRRRRRASSLGAFSRRVMPEETLTTGGYAPSAVPPQQIPGRSPFWPQTHSAQVEPRPMPKSAFSRYAPTTAASINAPEHHALPSEVHRTQEEDDNVPLALLRTSVDLRHPGLASGVRA
ncbi:hypothetical protein THASP1DRAFT_28390, partial [Thamnocephalis sphaerospora]